MSTIPLSLNEEVIRSRLRSVYDPEFGVSIEDLGLIYQVQINQGHVGILMTLTSMYCPAGQVIMDGVKAAVEGLPGVQSCQVDLVWDPAWTPEMLSPTAREQLGWNESPLQN